MILVIDNYDSFVYNLVQYIGSETDDIEIRRNDQITLDDVQSMAPRAVVLSPGPGHPEVAGICIDLIRRFGAFIPILGVCLGHQAIAVAYGGKVCRAGKPLHGKTSNVMHDGLELFEGIAGPTLVTRYHSLMVADEDLPSNLRVTARADDGTIMALRHRLNPVYGVQFHPESILSEDGPRLIRNFIHLHGLVHDATLLTERLS